MYFDNVNDLDNLQIQYKQLCLKLHPDKGGKTTDFQKMKAEYEQRYSEIQQEEADRKADVEAEEAVAPITLIATALVSTGFKELYKRNPKVAKGIDKATRMLTKNFGELLSDLLTNQK